LANRVYITRPIAEEAVAMLRDVAEVSVWPDPDLPPPYEVLLREAGGIDGLVCLLTDRIDAELLRAGARLKVVSNVAVGYDNIDVAAATARKVMVCNTPGVLTETTADLAWALVMAAGRRISEADRYLREGRWKSWSPQLLLGQDIYGATLGVVGFGRIGQAVGRRAKGFGMTVLYCARSRKPEAEKEIGADFVTLPELLKRSDFVSIHTPLTPETRHLIGAKELAMMKPTAVLVNTARGPIVDESALAQALRERVIFAAGLDVFESEPLAQDSPLLGLENVVLLPHVGSASVATRTLMARMAAENLVAGLKGQRPPYLVNEEVLSSCCSLTT
jgi:glyoxylate reductase